MNAQKRKIIVLLGCVAVIAYSSWALLVDFNYSISNIVRFLRHDGHRQEILSEAEVYRDILEIQKIIPPESRIQFSSPKLNYKTVAMRYYLYPMEVSRDWQYFVDVDDYNKDFLESQDVPSRRFTNGTVYALPGNFFWEGAEKFRSPPMGVAALVFLLTVLMKTVAGLLILRGMNKDDRPVNIVGNLSLSYLLGELLLTSALWLYLILGGIFAKESQQVLCLQQEFVFVRLIFAIS